MADQWLKDALCPDRVYLAIIKSNDILSSHYRPGTKSHHPSPTLPPSIVNFLFPLNHGAMTSQGLPLTQQINFAGVLIMNHTLQQP